jgi:beta-galactosidase
MFDYASPARNRGINHSGVVGYDHATPKDAYYLYRAMWNADVPTLHIADRSWRERRDTLQQIDVYSSVGEPLILVGGDTVKVQNVAPARYHADSVVIKGRARIEAYDASGIHRDAIDVRCGEF